MIDIITLSTRRVEQIAEILEINGVEVFISNPLIDSEIPSKKYATLRVARNDAGRAIKILEAHFDNFENISHQQSGSKLKVLIPVDFSDKSLMGIKVGFGMAARLGYKPVIMHSYAVLNPDSPLSTIDEELSADNIDFETREILIEQTAQKNLKTFCEKVCNWQQQGIVKNLKFDSLIAPGLPEEVILNVSKQDDIALVVMTSRESSKRVADIVGSVTAEVLDHCAVPLLTVPGNYEFQSIRSIKKVSFFCHLDKNDYTSMEEFLSLFGYPEIEITLLPSSEKDERKQAQSLEMLCHRFSRLFPSVTFKTIPADSLDIKPLLHSMETAGNLQLIVAQNRKRNIFKRLLNPGIAHMLFYERDIPMMVWPM